MFSAVKSETLPTEMPGYTPHSGNPILPGYYADPSLVQYEGKFYIYATLDPWGGSTLGCWESTDFKNWTYRKLNWPTKAACTSPTSGGAGVWAPSVLRAVNGRFYMYVSVGSEVWVGVAEQPTGPWVNALEATLGRQPLINQAFRPGFHMIDAEAFVDKDGTGYLYWGSGFDWKNGKCWAVKLKSDMVTFDGEVREITPGNYFEGPFMARHGDKYYLSYSQGITVEESYQVHYAIGDSPLGPFVEASNSPILVTDKAKNVISPGHHAMFTKDGKDYILYHRHSIPFEPAFVGRQVCVDEIHYTDDGLIAKVVPTHTGPDFLQNRLAKPPLPAIATASSQRKEYNGPDYVLDDNYATRWAPAAENAQAWVQLDFGKVQKIEHQEIRSEYAWKDYFFKIEASDDAKTWRPVVDFTEKGISGSPILLETAASGRYLRLTFSASTKSSETALFEWAAY